MTQSDIEQQIGRFMSRTFLFEFADGVNAETDLFEAGLIDSFGFVELVQFVERAFGVSLSDDDLASTQTATLSGIARLVVARRTTTDVTDAASTNAAASTHTGPGQ